MPQALDLLPRCTRSTSASPSRTSHAPCPLAPKCLKHLIFYLLQTIDVGLTIPRPIDAKIDWLIWASALRTDYLLDTKAKTLQYHIVLDGAASAWTVA
jgi:hypothetical protein